VQVPGLNNVTSPEAILHTEGVAEAMPTGNPDVACAVTINPGEPNKWPVIGRKVIDCGAAARSSEDATMIAKKLL
jgi:hypothetical protein